MFTLLDISVPEEGMAAPGETFMAQIVVTLPKADERTDLRAELELLRDANDSRSFHSIALTPDVGGRVVPATLVIFYMGTIHGTHHYKGQLQSRELLHRRMPMEFFLDPTTGDISMMMDYEEDPAAHARLMAERYGFY